MMAKIWDLALDIPSISPRFRSAVGGSTSTPSQGGNSRMYDAEADQ